MEQNKKQEEKPVVKFDKRKAISDIKILDQAREILEDKDRLSAVRLMKPNVDIAPSGKGNAFKGSRPLDIVGLQESVENIHNVFKDVTKVKEIKDGKEKDI